jgi:hypothetical protein
MSKWTSAGAARKAHGRKAGLIVDADIMKAEGSGEDSYRRCTRQKRAEHTGAGVVRGAGRRERGGVDSYCRLQHHAGYVRVVWGAWRGIGQEGTGPAWHK